MPHIYNRRDLSFQLYDVLNVEKLCQSSRYQDHSKEIFEQLIDLVDRMAEELFQPHAALSDAQEPVFDAGRVRLIPEIKQALDAYIDAGLPAASFDTEFGGMQLPYVVTQAMAFIFGAANSATSGYAMLSAAAANLLSV